MRKIKTLFKIDPITHLITEEVVPGSEWVLNGEGRATEKFNGTSCMIREGQLFRRYDRKNLNKDAPSGWEPCESEPDKKSGHWPGWIPVSPDDPADKWHLEAIKDVIIEISSIPITYELVGPKIQGNPYKLAKHVLFVHGAMIIDTPRTFNTLKEYLLSKFDSEPYFEGIVWHRDNGDMVKLRVKDFAVKKININKNSIAIHS